MPGGDDYHRWLKKRVRKLRKTLLELDPGCRAYPTVDTSPRARTRMGGSGGVAWIGKSTMAIHPRLGTYTFLATILTDSLLVADEAIPDRCGSCTACLDACPTDAFVEPYVLDARRCLSYWTLEVPGPYEGSVPPPRAGVAGCDICQEVCPWNRFARVSDDPKTEAREGFEHVESALDGSSGEGWLLDLIRGTALQRTGAPALLRNLRRVEEEESSE